MAELTTIEHLVLTTPVDLIWPPTQKQERRTRKLWTQLLTPRKSALKNLFFFFGYLREGISDDSSESDVGSEHKGRLHQKPCDSYEAYDRKGRLAHGMDCDPYMGIRLAWKGPQVAGPWLTSDFVLKGVDHAMFSFDRGQDAMRFLHLDAENPVMRGICGFHSRRMVIGECRQTIYGH